MKKVLITILAAILIVVVIVAVLVNRFGDRALKVGIETAATRILGVAVTVEEVSLSLFGGTLDLNGLVISNPVGYEYPNLLELGTAHVDVDVKSLLSDTVNIEEIRLDEVTVVIEQKGLSNNLNVVLAAIPIGAQHADKP